MGGRTLATKERQLAATSEAQSLSADLESGLGEMRLRFAAVGDVGTGDRPQYKVANAIMRQWQTAPFPLTLLTGDNIYLDGDIEKIQATFDRPYASLLKSGVKFYAVLGNHDFRTNRGDDGVHSRRFE